MSRKKRKKQSQSLTISGINPLTGDLTKRAVTAELVYGMIKQVGETGPDGVQRAYIDVQSNSIEADTPTNEQENAVNSMYGLAPISAASETEPFSLIPKYDEPDFEPDRNKESRSQLRQILSRLVDEV